MSTSDADLQEQDADLQDEEQGADKAKSKLADLIDAEQLELFAFDELHQVRQ